jgi:hypothetical protein
MQNLVMRYGPQCKYVFFIKGQCAELGYELWENVQNFMLCAMEKCAEFGYVLWVSVQNH